MQALDTPANALFNLAAGPLGEGTAGVVAGSALVGAVGAGVTSAALSLAMPKLEGQASLQYTRWMGGWAESLAGTVGGMGLATAGAVILGAGIGAGVGLTGGLMGMPGPRTALVLSSLASVAPMVVMEGENIIGDL